MRCIVLCLLFALARSVLAQVGPSVAAPQSGFILGADVSFLRDLETKGMAFSDDGVTKPGLQILRSHGFNWVRLRVMNEPTSLPNNLAYTVAEAKEAKAMGFKFLLDLHYSDDWADPSHEKTPKAWSRLSHEKLLKAVFVFSQETIEACRQAGAMPDMVQVGNEITNGMLWPDGRLPERWDQFAELLTSGVRGVEAGSGEGHRPAIMIHIDQGGNQETTQWFFDNLIGRHVPFDVIGQSYYPWWQGSLHALRDNLAFMARRYKKPIVLAEIAWDWKSGEEFNGKKREYPETPEGQEAFLHAVLAEVRATPGGLGMGVFWWEPMADGPISKRALFTEEGKSLPALLHLKAPPGK